MVNRGKSAVKFHVDPDWGILSSSTIFAAITKTFGGQKKIISRNSNPRPLDILILSYGTRSKE